jgi:precorrin-6B methylase 1
MDKYHVGNPTLSCADNIKMDVIDIGPTFADRGCCVVSATDPLVVSLGFLDRSRYYFFQVAPQLSSRV